jgi:macrodomain Ter protein organizer (MatP/YcbG family)
MNMQERKKVTSLRIDEGLWKEAKVYAVEQDTTLGDLVERLLSEEIAKAKNKKKQDAKGGLSP